MINSSSLLPPYHWLSKPQDTHDLVGYFCLDRRASEASATALLAPSATWQPSDITPLQFTSIKSSSAVVNYKALGLCFTWSGRAIMHYIDYNASHFSIFKFFKFKFFLFINFSNLNLSIFKFFKFEFFNFSIFLNFQIQAFNF